MKAPLAFLLSLTFSAQGQINLPTTLTIDGTEYTEVAYRTHDAAKLTFTHSSGVTSVEIPKLPPEVVKGIDYDPEKAEAQTKSAAAAQAQAAIQAKTRQQALAQRTASDAALSDLKKSARTMYLEVSEKTPNGIICYEVVPITRNPDSGMLNVNYKAVLRYKKTGTRIIARDLPKAESLATGDVVEVKAAPIGTSEADGWISTFRVYQVFQ